MREKGENYVKEITPMFWCKNSNWRSFKGFMKRLAFWSSVLMNLRVRMPYLTNSQMKWCQISTCLVRECWTGFLEILVALVLSQYMLRYFWQIPLWEPSPKVPLIKREIFGVLFRTPLFLGKWCGAATYFLYKKIRKNKYKIHDWIVLLIDWIKKSTYLKNWKLHGFGS